MLAAKYFDAMCIDSFTQGLPLSNFVPPPPSPAPSDYPVSVDEDLLRAWNSTIFSSAVKGIACAWCLSLSGLGFSSSGEVRHLPHRSSSRDPSSARHFGLAAAEHRWAELLAQGWCWSWSTTPGSASGAPRDGDTIESPVASLMSPLLGRLLRPQPLPSPATLHGPSLNRFCPPEYFPTSIFWSLLVTRTQKPSRRPGSGRGSELVLCPPGTPPPSPRHPHVVPGSRGRQEPGCELPSLLLRDRDLGPGPAPHHPRAHQVHVLHAGNRLLLPQWRGGPPPADEGGDGGHPGRHHRAQRLGVSALHLRPLPAAQARGEAGGTCPVPWSRGGGQGTWGHLPGVLLGGGSVLEHGPALEASGHGSMACLVPQVRGTHLRQRPEIHPGFLRGQGSCHGAQDRRPENRPGGSTQRQPWHGRGGEGGRHGRYPSSTAVLSTEESGGALSPWGAQQLPPQWVWPSMASYGCPVPSHPPHPTLSHLILPRPIPPLPSSTSAMDPALLPPLTMLLCSSRSSTTTRATTACPPTSTLSTTPSCEPTCPRAKATLLPTVRTWRRWRAEARWEQR